VRKARLLAAVLFAAVTVLGLGATGASAETVAPQNQAQILAQLQKPAATMGELQQQINLQLKLAPGGQQTAPNEVSYAGGRFVVTYAMPGSVNASPDCPGGWFCFYDHTNWGYPRGKLSDCGWQDLGRFGWNDRTESVDNSTGNSIEYINHFDYGNPANGHRFDYTLFWNGAWNASSTVPYPNMADHVVRHC
jgi:hypothetical protein